MWIARVAIAAALAWCCMRPVIALAQAANECDIAWQITPLLGASPRHLSVTLRFNAGTRSRTELQLPQAWAGVDDYANHLIDLRSSNPLHAIEPVAGQPLKRVIQHRPGEAVALSYRITSPIKDADATTPRGHRDSYRTLLGARWFQVFGHALLAVPATNTSDTATQRLCMDFEGLDATGWWANSHDVRQNSSMQIRFKGSVEQMRHAVYLGGDLQLRERRVEGRPVFSVMPPATPLTSFAPSIDALADRVAQLIAAQRSFWRDHEFPHQLVVLQPNHSPRGNYGGTAVHQAFVMHASNDLQVPGASFDHLVTHELLHTWIPMRFGPMTYTGRDDEALRYWFSEGFTDHYTHRLLVQSGLWTLADMAQALNAKIDRHRQSPALRADNAQVAANFFTDEAMGQLPYARGEWLALRWHAALRDKGHPGLDAVMRRLLLPAALAKPTGPLSKPLVTHRLLAELRPVLGEAPLADIANFVDKGQSFEFTDTTLGPCFKLERLSQPVWQLGFDRATLQQRVMIGVDPDGPAHAAGLRNGMAVRGTRIYNADVTQDVLIQVPADDGQVRDIRYRPIGAAMREVLRYRPVAGGLEQATCRAWMGGDASADDVAAAAISAKAATALAARKASPVASKKGGKKVGKKAGKSDKSGQSGKTSKAKAKGKPTTAKSKRGG